MPDFVVLRNAAGPHFGAPFDISRGVEVAHAGKLDPTFFRSLQSAAAPQPQVERYDLSENEVQDMARDSTVTAIARLIPTTLIQPVGSTPAGATGTTWGIDAVGAAASKQTGHGVRVAILDTGIDRTHEAFQDPHNPLEIVEKDFSGSGNGDRVGHGTHCAGTIFGRAVGGQRIGVAPGVENAFVGKVLKDDGSGDSHGLFRAIQWAVSECNADVVSMSLGFDFPGMVDAYVKKQWPVALATSTALEAYRGNLRMFDALMQMIRASAFLTSGAVVVAAAGNESQRDVNPKYKIAASLPAAAEDVISVGALEQAPGGLLSVASFSNIFPQISAPGTQILSAQIGGGLTTKSGTSMACPHVAGVACLWWQALRDAHASMATAGSVGAKLLANARTQGFAPNVEVSDRGAGLVTAPP
jgi:subtilisin family serine protease